MGGSDCESTGIKLLIEDIGVNEIIHEDKATSRIKFQEYQDLKVRYKIHLEEAAKEGEGKTDIKKFKGIACSEKEEMSLRCGRSLRVSSLFRIWQQSPANKCLLFHKHQTCQKTLEIYLDLVDQLLHQGITAPYGLSNFFDCEPQREIPFTL